MNRRQSVASDDLPRLVAVVGTYDTGQPRLRILIRGLRENNVQTIECHFDVWRGIQDKSLFVGPLRWLRLLFRFSCAYPVLVFKYLRLPKHDTVLISHPGILDLLILWPLIRIRRARLIWDAFIPNYSTVVEDRGLVGTRNLVARMIWWGEWLALRIADLVITDTKTHARYLCQTFDVAEERVQRVLVGVEPEVFAPPPEIRFGQRQHAPSTLFYGQFIPLHGVETIVRAAALTSERGFCWRLIGRGQTANHVAALIQELECDNIDWRNWIPYENLIDEISRCDVGLGIFGSTLKANRVVPNKVYQLLAAQRPLITADTTAIRELGWLGPGVILIPPNDPQALADAVTGLISIPRKSRPSSRLPKSALPEGVGRQLIRALGPVYRCES